MRRAICQDTVVVRAPAKVNLFLEVLGKRSDGFHEIATLMVAIRLMDTLVFKEEADAPMHQFAKLISHYGTHQPAHDERPNRT